MENSQAEQKVKEGVDSTATVGEVVVEDSCIVFRQDVETGDVRICPKPNCEPGRADPQIREKLMEMARQMTAKGGKLMLVIEYLGSYLA